jgi:hypothetical protein
VFWMGQTVWQSQCWPVQGRCSLLQPAATLTAQLSATCSTANKACSIAHLYTCNDCLCLQPKAKTTTAKPAAATATTKK